MKRVLVLVLLLITNYYLNAQNYVPKREDILAFFKTKTLVVLEDNPLSEYNIIIKEVMKQEWKVTPYDFISKQEFESKRFDPQYSFIYLSKVSFERDKTDAEYRFLFLSLGGNYFQLSQMPDLVAVPVSYYGVDEDSYGYKMGILVRFMQNHILLLKEHPEISSSNVFEYYNKNIKDIKDKTLYLLENELSKEVNTPARIRKVYPYKFKIVTKEEIEKAIRERDPNVVFLHKVGPEGTKTNARCYKILIGAADANFYYFDYHKVSDKRPDGMLESDFKNLAKK